MRLIRLYAARACFRVSTGLPCSDSGSPAFETETAPALERAGAVSLVFRGGLGG